MSRHTNGRNAPCASVIADTSGLRLPPWWLAAYAALLMYASLLPFDWVLPPREIPFAALFPWAETSLEDFLTNLIIYVPAGVLFALCATRKSPWSAGLMGAFLIGAAVSLLCELSQVFISSRVASRLDFILNIMGTGLGYGTGMLIRRFSGVRGVRQLCLEAPFQAGALVLTIGLILVNLTPLSCVATTADLHESFSRADLMPCPSIFEWNGHAWNGLAWFTVLGLLAATAALEAGRRPPAAFCWAARHAVIVVALVEILQIFTHSHMFEFSAMVQRSGGALIGAWAGAFVIMPPTFHPGAAPHGPDQGQLLNIRCIPSSTLVIVILVLTTLLLLGNSGSTPSEASYSDADRALFLPFEAAWRRPFQLAAVGLLTTMAPYAIFAAMLLILGHRISFRRPALFAIGLTVLISSLAEVIAVFKVGCPGDPTSPILAFAAAMAVAHINPASPMGAARMTPNFPRASA